MDVEVKNALISVQNKTNIEKLAEILKKFNVNIYATDGTKKFLEEKNFKVNSITAITDNNQILGGRVKTLDFKLFAGILADSNNPEHINDLKKLKVPKINLVVVNLYDFYGAISSKKNQDELVEFIDIGGVTLLRAASKNYKSCVTIPAVCYYDDFIEHLNKNNGKVDISFRKQMAIRSFEITSSYDNLISYGINGMSDVPDFFPLYKSAGIELRYGENPHQKAAIFEFLYNRGDCIINRLVKGAKEVSYNNILDANSAFEIARDFTEPTAIVVKHQNPCAVMSSDKKEDVCSNVFSLDIESSFGGILGVNFNIDVECAKIISRYAPLLHCIVAPDVSDDAIVYLKTYAKGGKNINFFLYKSSDEQSVLNSLSELDIKSIPGALLVQQRDFFAGEITYEIANGNVQRNIIEDLLFGFKVAKFAKSNSVVIVKNKKTLGIGSGQTSRVGAVQNAISKIKEKPLGASLASDAFFPFPDSLELASNFGIKNFIAPKGSVNDDKVVEFAKKNNLTLLFTNVRHFRH